MKEIFEKRDGNRVTRHRCKLNLNIPRRNQVTFGTKSLTFYGIKIWNALPVNTETTRYAYAFKDLIQSVMVFHATAFPALINSSFLIIIIIKILCV